MNKEIINSIFGNSTKVYHLSQSKKVFFIKNLRIFLKKEKDIDFVKSKIDYFCKIMKISDILDYLLRSKNKMKNIPKEISLYMERLFFRKKRTPYLIDVASFHSLEESLKYFKAKIKMLEEENASIDLINKYKVHYIEHNYHNSISLFRYFLSKNDPIISNVYLNMIANEKGIYCLTKYNKYNEFIEMIKDKDVFSDFYDIHLSSLTYNNYKFAKDLYKIFCDKNKEDKFIIYYLDSFGIDRLYDLFVNLKINKNKILYIKGQFIPKYWFKKVNNPLDIFI